MPHITSFTEAERAALDYIAENNADGGYDDVLEAFNTGTVSIGLLAFKGEGLPALRYEQNRLYNLLQGRPHELLDVDVPAVTKAHARYTELIAQTEHAVANPVIYVLKKEAAA